MSYLSVVFTFLPLIFLLWLANVADKRLRQTPPRQGAAIIVYGLLTLAWLMLLAVSGVGLLIGIAYARYADINAMWHSYQVQGMDPEMMVAFMQSLPRLSAGSMVLALAGLALLLPPVRRLIARIIPLTATSVTHAVALAYSMLILLNMWLIMGVGLDVVADAVANGPEAPGSEIIILLWLQNILLAFMALVGVGWLSRRGFRSTLQRLGLVRPTWRQAGLGVGLGIAAFLLLFPLSLLLDKTGAGIDPNVDKLVEELIGPLMTSIPGILSLGFAAALGEELVYRGALQPRFGILLTAVLFSLTHNQYGISAATLVVLLIGLLLGWTRRRTNTTTSILLHATYNIAIGLSGFLFQ